jgi:hypothetical protein
VSYPQSKPPRRPPPLKAQAALEPTLDLPDDVEAEEALEVFARFEAEEGELPTATATPVVTEAERSYLLGQLRASAPPPLPPPEPNRPVLPGLPEPLPVAVLRLLMEQQTHVSQDLTRLGVPQDESLRTRTDDLPMTPDTDDLDGFGALRRLLLTNADRAHELAQQTDQRLHALDVRLDHLEHKPASVRLPWSIQVGLVAWVLLEAVGKVGPMVVGLLD